MKLKVKNLKIGDVRMRTKRGLELFACENNKHIFAFSSFDSLKAFVKGKTQGTDHIIKSDWLFACDVSNRELFNHFIKSN